MSIDQIGRDAAADLVAHTRPDAAAGLRELTRLRTRRRAERALATVAALLVVVALSWAAVRGDQRGSEPIDRRPPIRNGVLVTTDRELVVELAATPRMRLAARPSDRRDGTPIAFTADGAEMVYENRLHQVAAMDVHTGVVRILAVCPADPCDVALSPDEKSLAFHGAAGLQVLDLASGRTRSVATPRSSWFPAWSADGRRLAFHSKSGIQVVDADGTDRHLVYAFTPHHSAIPQLSWAPNGDALTFTRMDDVLDRAGRVVESEFGVMVARTDGSGAKEVQPAGRCLCLGLAPAYAAWSPDGTWIAFSRIESGRLGNHSDSRADGTYVMRPDGSGLRSVGPPGAYLAWQPLPRS